MKIVEHCWPHRRALFVTLLLLVAAGVTAIFSSGRGIYPDVRFQRIAIIAERGESPVRAMLIEVTRPIEQAVSTVPDLARVRSKTVRGATELSLDFLPRADVREALSLVRSRTQEAALPRLETLTIERQTPSLFPVISFNVLPGVASRDDPVARAKLAEWVELHLQPRLSRLSDAFFVTVQSGDQREYTFEVTPTALAQSGLDILALQSAVAAGDVVQAVALEEREGLQYQVLVDGRFTAPEQLLDLSIPRDGKPPVKLADLGQLRETTALRSVIVTGGGVDGVVVSLFLRDGGKVTDLSRDVRRVVDEIADLVPGDGTIETVYDQAVLVDASINGVRDAIVLGGTLAVLLLLVFLGNWRITVVAGLAVPLSVILTLALFPVVGETLNLMSLGGLAVAIGLVIDDAIVVVENVARRLGTIPADRSSFQDIFRAVADGTSGVFGAIVGSSLTTVVVFVPLVLLEGVAGQFFRSLSLALGISILVSMVVSLVYSPLTLLLPGLLPTGGERPRRWMTFLQDLYASLLARLLQHRALLALTLILAWLGGASQLRDLETGFLPEMDEGGFVLDYTLPVGSSLFETDAVCRRIEEILLETPEVLSLSRRTGAELGFFATEQFTGDMLVGLVPHAKRDRSVFDVMDGLRQQVARRVPQAEVEFIQVMQDTINDLAGNPEPIEVKLLGADYPILQAAADRVEAAIDQIPGLVDVANHVSFGSPELTWRVDRDAAARIGLNDASIADQVAAQALGVVIARIEEGERFVDVRLRYANATFPDDSAVPMLGPIPGLPGTGMVPLTSVATLVRKLSENELERENQVPMVRVTAAIFGTDLGSASWAVENAVEQLRLDPAVRVEYGGQSASQGGAFENLLLVFALAAGLTFLLLVIQFRSMRLPIVMFLAMPFGQLGGLLALHVTGVPLNVSSGMGLLMLVGLVVKNGIILIESMQQLARDGASERDAIVQAARVRVRPIVMTTLAAIAGLLPLAYGIGAGSELQRPLAIAVIGGLLLSTASTLLIVPLGCATLAAGTLGPEKHNVD